LYSLVSSDILALEKHHGEQQQQQHQLQKELKINLNLSFCKIGVFNSRE